MRNPSQSITKPEISGLWKEVGSPWGSQVEIELTPWGGKDRSDGNRESGGNSGGYSRGGGGDYFVQIGWRDVTYEFVAVSKTRSIPKEVKEAMFCAEEYARGTGLRPMIIVPYLSPKQIDQLLENEVSGLDLCGNGLVIIPGRMLLSRSGKPNRYRESQPTRYGYRGATSLVPRTFLCRSKFARVSEVQDEIKARGGNIALSTISKALDRMDKDVLIDRGPDRISLLQPEALLEKLVSEYRPPRITETVQLKTGIPLREVFRQAESPLSMALSGVSSMDRYAVGGRADEPTVYCNDLDILRDRLGSAWNRVDRFADLTVSETRDKTPYFDVRRGDDGIFYASPLQVYLELVAGKGSEKRDRQIAEQVREGILRDLVAQR